MSTGSQSRRRGWSWPLKVGVALAGLVAATVLVAGWDFHALMSHAGAGPHNFHGANCAGGTQAAAGAAAVSDPTLGLTAWPVFQATPTHNLVLPGVTSNGQPLSVAWRFNSNGSIVTAPSVVDGVAYIGSMDGCVYALDVATGHLIWSFAANNQIMSEPLVVGGSVYFSSGNKEMVSTPTGVVRGSGPDAIYALDASTGQLRWMVPTVGEGMPTPVYANGVVYEATGGKRFYAVSAASGKLLWSTAIGAYVSMSSPTLVGDIAVFGGADPYGLYGINVKTHQLAWTVPFPQANSAVDDLTPAISGGVAYIQVPEGHFTKRIVEVAVRVSDGKVLWQRTLGTDRINFLQRALWQGDLGGRDGEEAGVATVVGGRVYVGTPALNGLWALDAATGAVLWRSPLPASVRDAPAVGAGGVYAASDTRLFVIDPSTGALRTQMSLGSWVNYSGVLIPCATAGPVIIGRTLLVGVGTDSSGIEAIPLKKL